MIKNLTILGLILSLMLFAIFYGVAAAHLVPAHFMSPLLNIVLPLILGGYALFLRARAGESSYRLVGNVDFKRVLICGGGLAVVSCAIVAYFNSAFLGKLALLYFTQVLSAFSSVLFWVGFVWPVVEKWTSFRSLYHKAIVLTAVQLAFLLSVFALSIIPVLALNLVSAWTVYGGLKAFQSVGLFMGMLLGMLFMLVLGGLINYWNIQLLRRSGSALYAALVYALPLTAAMSSSYALEPIARVFLAVAGIAAYAYLYISTARLERPKA
jgi:hypothetical protein